MGLDDLGKRTGRKSFIGCGPNLEDKTIMRDTFIVRSARTPIGNLNGVLAGLSAVDLGRVVVGEILKRCQLEPSRVDEVIIGNVLQTGLGQNPARQIALGVGLPNETRAFTVNKVCGSGMKSIELGWQSILLGRAHAVIAGGIESMTQAPYILRAMRAGARLGDSSAIDTVLCDGLIDAFSRSHMGLTAETIAEKYSISRTEQDAFALESHQKCVKAVAEGKYSEEIVPILVPKQKDEIIVKLDERPRPDTSLEKLAALPPAFKKNGTVTAGNTSGINDGAAAVILVAGEAEIDRSEAVRIRDVSTFGCDPEMMGLAAIGAVQKLLKNNGLSVGDIDLWELNEAFAAQSIAVIRELRVNPDKVNVNGGAIALGHPIGASGTRIVVTLIHEMKRQQASLGVAAMCIGGGMGIGILLENV